MPSTDTVERPYLGRLVCDYMRPSWARRRGPMQIPDILRKCVLFIGIKKDDQFLPRATGFLTIINEFGYEWMYLVTAEHVVSGLISKGHEIYVRYNLVDGGTVVSGPVKSEVWFFHPTTDQELSTDVAVAPFRPQADESILPIELNGDYSIVCSDEVIKKHQIDCGEEVAVIGLFRTHHGVGKIIPVVRTGHIAVMQEEPVSTKYCGYVDAYLIEAMSIAGLSGSPVFVHLAPWRVVGKEIQKLNSFRFWLLGLMHGHFDVQNLNEDVVTDSDGQSLGSINAGLGVVIPAEKIVETIFQPELVAMRKKNADQARDKGGATSDAIADDDLPASGENPTHREDFTRLVGAAARKPVPKG